MKTTGLMRVGRAIALLGVLLGAPGLAAAQGMEKGDYVPGADAEAVRAEPSEAPDGWALKLRLGSTGAFNNNSKVVGAGDGTTIQIGLVLDARADLKAGQHEWLNSLGVQHQQTRSPAIERFVKSTDNADLESIYLYRMAAVPWLGPFGRFRLNTQLLASEYVQGQDTVVLRGADRLDVPAKEAVDLTAAFEPLIMRESTGFFARPIEQPSLTFDGKLGGGAQEILTQDGYVVADDDGTPEVELAQLRDVNQIGVEAEVSLEGKVDKRFSWSAQANVLHPLYTSIDTGDLQGLELMNVEGEAKLSYQLAGWLAVEYVFSAKKIPLVLDEWQIQNGLLFSAAFEVSNAPPPSAPPAEPPHKG